MAPSEMQEITLVPYGNAGNYPWPLEKCRKLPWPRGENLRRYKYQPEEVTILA